MNTDIEQLCTRHGVTIVREYDQMADSRLTREDITENGACLGLVCQWLADKRAGQDFWIGYTSGASLPAVRNVMARQSLINARTYLQDMLRKVPDILRLKGFNYLGKMEIGAPGATTTSGVDIYNAVGANFAPYNLIAIAGQGGGHAVGYYRNHPYYKFFDPNTGEFSFPGTTAVHDWMGAYFGRYGYNTLRMLEIADIYRAA